MTEFQGQGLVRFFLENLFEITVELIRERDPAIIGPIMGFLMLFFIALLILVITIVGDSIELGLTFTFLLSIPAILLVYILTKRVDERGSKKDLQNKMHKINEGRNPPRHARENVSQQPDDE